MIDVWGVHWESTLHADAEGHLADGEGLADTGVLTTDNNAAEHLDTGLGALDDLDVNVEGIAWAEIWDVGTQLCCIDLVKNMHGYNPSCSSG